MCIPAHPPIVRPVELPLPIVTTPAMKTRISFGAGCLLLLLGCSFHPQPSLSRPSPVDISCPYGHQAVRRVPVLNGLIAIDRHLQAKAERFEVVLGGCTGSDLEAVICAKCGFRYYAETRKWERTSNNARSFNPPISTALRRFENLCPLRVFEYRQEIDSDGSLAERSVLVSDEDVNTLQMLVAARMQEQGAKELVRGSIWRSDEWAVVCASGGNGNQFTSMLIITHQLAKANQPPAASSLR
jgi:hypothetical protein